MTSHQKYKHHWAVEVKLMDGTKTLRPYINKDLAGAIAAANNRADVLAATIAHKITKEQYDKLLSLVPENKRDTSKRRSS